MNVDSLGVYQLGALSSLVSDYATNNNLNNKKITNYLTESEGRYHCGALSVASLCHQTAIFIWLFFVCLFF